MSRGFFYAQNFLNAGKSYTTGTDGIVDVVDVVVVDDVIRASCAGVPLHN
jgi:hypothetical protein